MVAVSSHASLLAAQFAAAVDAPGFDPAVKRSRHADFQADGVLPLARSLGRDPRELATAVAAQVPGGAVAGPGFVNVDLPDRQLWEHVRLRLAEDDLGVGAPEHGVRTVIDYSQPNIAKEMHVGHLRSTVLGDALARVLTRLGGTVVRQNHIGDWGTQFGMLIEYQMGSATIADLGGLYRKARARFDADPDFADRARARVVALQAGDPATRAVWRAIVAESTAYFTAVYDRLGVLLTPADTVGESAYNDALPAVAAELAGAGVATTSDGALCVFFDDLPAPLIVRKRDGGFGYAATDLAALRHRASGLAADRILYVVDSRQQLHLRTVRETAVRAGWLPARVEVVHVAFGAVLDRSGRPMKTRDGEQAKLTDLLDAAVARARSVIAAKHPDLGPEALDGRAAQVGIGALKYADLSAGRTRDYVFDLDRMLALTGNTAVYLQYAHARTRSVLARAGGSAGVHLDAPLQPPERALALRLDAFGDVLREVAAGYGPHLLCTYLFALAQEFATFWERCPVLKSPGPVRDNRLALCALTARTLHDGLDLLGVAAPDRL